MPVGFTCYAQRYRQPRVNPRRVAIEIAVTRMTGSKGMTR